MKNSIEVFIVVELNIRMRGNIFQMYYPISWTFFAFINTVRPIRREKWGFFQH